jgi:hypothetical protein
VTYPPRRSTEPCEPRFGADAGDTACLPSPAAACTPLHVAGAILEPLLRNRDSEAENMAPSTGVPPLDDRVAANAGSWRTRRADRGIRPALYPG